MGLGVNQESRATYLSVAGGYIWDKSKEEDHPMFKVQGYEKANGEEGERKGARYDNLSGTIKSVDIRTHDQYGESMRVKVFSEGEEYILSIPTNNPNGQHMMKALLLLDLSSEVFINPYDFESDSGKRSRGISFRQNGAKIDLRSLKVSEEFEKDKSFWKTASTKIKKRFFEDFADYLVAEVTEKVIPNLEEFGKKSSNEEASEPKKVEAKKEPVKTQATKVDRPSVIKMRKFIKNYIEENYSEESLPKLSKEQVSIWYDLALQEEELPFNSLDVETVKQDELEEELKGLLKK